MEKIFSVKKVRISIDEEEGLFRIEWYETNRIEVYYSILCVLKALQREHVAVEPDDLRDLEYEMRLILRRAK